MEITAVRRTPHPDQRFFKMALGAGVVRVRIMDVSPCQAPDECALAGQINTVLSEYWSKGAVYLLVVRWESRTYIFEGGSGRPGMGNL